MIDTTILRNANGIIVAMKVKGKKADIMADLDRRVTNKKEEAYYES